MILNNWTHSAQHNIMWGHVLVLCVLSSSDSTQLNGRIPRWITFNPLIHTIHPITHPTRIALNIILIIITATIFTSTDIHWFIVFWHARLNHAILKGIGLEMLPNFIGYLNPIQAKTLILSQNQYCIRIILVKAYSIIQLNGLNRRRSRRKKKIVKLLDDKYKLQKH